MEQRSELRRLAPLGVEGNEPAIKAYCKTTPKEQQAIIEAILQQKVGVNAKSLKQYAEYRTRGVKMNKADHKKQLPCSSEGQG